MKAKFFCCKLNKSTILLTGIIIIQSIFIIIGIKQLREEKSFEQIAKNISMKDTYFLSTLYIDELIIWIFLFNVPVCKILFLFFLFSSYI